MSIPAYPQTTAFSAPISVERAPFQPTGTAHRLDNASYGGVSPARYGGAEKPTSVLAGALARGQHRRMNLVALSLAAFVPWLLFCAVFALMSFALHFQRPPLCFLLVGLGLVAVVAVGAVACLVIKRRRQGRVEPSWVVFLFLAMAVAWALGAVLGDLNYTLNMQAYYDLAALNNYPAVDPSATGGQEMMDAGRVIFSPDSKIDLQRSMGFKNLETYCVAPITVAQSDTLASYDYWVVGMNCCSTTSSDFKCGEYNNPSAHGGVRVMRDDERPFYRLAVLQAVASYQITASHPLFFEWVMDPTATMNAYQETGFKYFVLGMFCHFGFNLLCVGAAATLFTKMGLISA